MRKYVASLFPGKYEVRILYHDQVSIADRKEGVEGLICCRSEPITLTVKPGSMHLTPAMRKDIETWLSQIDEKAPLKIVAGTYGDWATDFVGPESPQGKLLASGPAAIPVLLDALDEKITPARRAIILSLLFSLTNQNDPRHAAGILPPFDAHSGPWSVWGDGGGGFSFGGEEHILVGSMDPVAQEEFAKRWKPWKSYLVVKEK